MRLKDIFSCALDAIFTKKWTNIVMIICMIITFDLVFTSAFLYNDTNFYKNRIKKAVKSDFDTTFNVTIESGSLMNENYLEQINEYIQSIKEINGVEFAGAYVTSMGFFNELAGKSAYRTINEGCNDELVLLNFPQSSMFLYTDYELFDMYEINYDEEQYRIAEEEGYIPVVVGNAYKDIVDEGDVLTCREESYKIINVLNDSNRRWISQSVGISVSSGNTLNLDYYFIIQREYCTLPADYMHSIYFGVDKHVSVTAVSAIVKAKASEFELHASVKSVADSLREIEESENEESKYITNMYISMFIVCIVSSVTVNIVSLLFRKKELGIFIANGVSIREILAMTVVETVIKVFCACAVTVAYELYSYMSYFGTATEEILISSLGNIWVMGAVILVISSIVPIFYIARKQPREFLDECL
ncbi:MAG: hypothetical protein ACI39R_08735 [Lachnospiraceae bacterium]